MCFESNNVTIITLCFILTDDLQINILEFVTGRGTIFQQHDQYSKLWQTHSEITYNGICCYKLKPRT